MTYSRDAVKELAEKILDGLACNQGWRDWLECLLWEALVLEYLRGKKDGQIQDSVKWDEVAKESRAAALKEASERANQLCEIQVAKQVAAGEAENKRLRKALVRCAIPLEALKIAPDGLGVEVITAIEDAVKGIRAALRLEGA